MKRVKLAGIIIMIILIMQIRFTMISNAEIITGSKENVSWSFDSENETLTFSGDGAITENWQSDIEQYGNIVKIVKIEEGITGIDREAFQDCEQLIKIEIPESVTYIGSRAFVGCESITNIQIPKNLTYIGDAFMGCTLLENVNIPEGIKNIEGGTFWGCVNLRNIVLPNSLTNIGASAFRDCASLEEIIIPSSVISIEKNAFANCKSMKKITILNNFTVIKADAFYDCDELTIYCNNSSLAEKYAKEFNISYMNDSKKMILFISPIIAIIVIIIIIFTIKRKVKTN